MSSTADDWAELAGASGPGSESPGHVSIVAKNVETMAVLHAHRGEWAEAIDAFDSDRQVNGLGVDTRGEHIGSLDLSGAETAAGSG